MNRVYRFLIVAILIIGFNQNLNAAYLRNVPQTIIQPDGAIIKCFASGDEFHNWLHDANNYTIIKEQDGYYYYAELEGDRLIASSFKVGKTYLKSTNLVPGVNISAERIREKRRNKLDGRPNYQKLNKLKASSDTLRLNNIVLFVRFNDDEEFTSDTTTFHEFYNREEENTNSLYNYYKEISYGTAFIKSRLFPKSSSGTVISYKDTKDRAYFQPYNDSTNTIGYEDIDSVRRNREFSLLERAIKYINENINIPLDLDYDNNGRIDNISFIVKGDADGWNDLLWPHNWQLYDRTVYINGLRVFNFNFLLETSTTRRGAGVLSHEMGHAIGYPDLYHYDEDSELTPVGPWDLMATTLNPPQGISAYLKHHVSGWVDTIPEITEAGTYTLNPLSSESNNVYKIASPYSTTEYFIVEYRKKEGTFESSIPESGLIVYRINEDAVTHNGGGNSEGPPDEIYVYRPDGTLNDNGTINEAAFSLESGRDSITSTSNPIPFLQSGGAGGLYISNVGSAGATISFDVDFRPNAIYANFIASKTQANTREEITFTNQSAGNPSSAIWAFEGGIPANFRGLTPPPIIYPETGTFDVTLSVSNSVGNSVETKTDYITIKEIPGTIPPTNLSSTTSGNDVVLNWTAPTLIGAEFTLQWDDGENNGSGVGLGETDSVSFDALSHWTPTQLANFNGMYLTEISFYPVNGQTIPTVKDYSLRVYTGLGATNLVIDEELPALDISFSQWNTFALETPYQINASKDLYFGLNNNSGNAASGYPFGIDAGPAIAGQGDVILRNGSLGSLSGSGLNNNWNLAATVVNSEASQKSVYLLKNEKAILKSITGYNIYRDEEKINTALISSTNYTDVDVPSGIYTYYATTLFSEGESAPSNKVTLTVSNTVGIDDLPTKEVSIYPNPVTDKLSVALGELRNQDLVVKIIDQNGRLVYSKEKNTSDDRLEINVNRLSPGVYTLHLIGEELIYQAKFIVVR